MAAMDMLSTIQGDLSSFSAESQPAETTAESPAATESTTTESSAEAAQTTETAPAAEPGTEPEAQAQTQDQQPVEQTDDDNDDSMPDVPGLTETRWTQRSKAFRWTKELAKGFGVIDDPKQPLDLNLLPPIEELVQGREALADQIAIQHDFASADPRNADSFIQHWNDTSPQGMAVMASRLADVLANGYKRADGTYAQPNEAAYANLATPVLNRYLQARVEQYRQVPDGDAKQALYYSIQQLHRDLTGQWMPPEQLDATTQTNDPLASERQALESERQKIQTWQQQQARQAFMSRKSGIDSTLNNVVTDSVTKALEPHSKAYEPAVFEALTEKLARTIAQELGQNTDTNRIFNIEYERALRSNDQNAIDALVKRQNYRVAAAVQRHAPKFISQATRTIVAQSEARHDQLRQAEAKRGPNGAAAPRPQTVVDPLQRKSDESANEFLRRQIAHSLGASA